MISNMSDEASLKCTHVIFDLDGLMLGKFNYLFHLHDSRTSTHPNFEKIPDCGTQKIYSYKQAVAYTMRR